MPDAAGPDLSPSPKQLLGALLALMLLAVAAFHEVPSNGYAFDAVYTVRDNPQVQQGASPVAILTAPYWDSEEHRGRGLYRPLSTLSFWLTRTLHPDPIALDHGLDVALHVFCSVLLLLVLMRLGAGFFAGLLLSSIYLVHPVQTEVVAGLVGRSDLLATAFALAALNLALAARRLGAGVSVGLFLLASASLLAKESTVTMPVLIPACVLLREIWRGAAISSALRLSARYALPLALALGLNLYLRHQVLGAVVVEEVISLVPSGGVAGLPAFAAQGFLAERWTALAYLTLYFEKLIWPSPLLPDYHSGVIDVGSASYHLRALLGLILLFSTVFWLGRHMWRASRSPLVEVPAGRLLGPSFVGIALFWIALSPVSNLVLPIGTLFGERLLYFPLAFLLIAPVALLAERHREGVRKLLPLAGAALIPVLVVLSAGRVPDWRSNRTLFEAAVRDAPGNYHSQMSYGATLLEGEDAGDVARAREAFLAAHAIRPEAYDPLAGLGKLELEWGETERARSHFEGAFERARPGSGDRHLAALNLAEVYRQVGRADDAEALLLAALSARPDSVPALRQLGDLHSTRGDIGAALQHYRRALALERDDPALWQRAIWGHLHLGQFAMARRLAAESPEGTFSSAFNQRLEREGIRLADFAGAGPEFK